MNDYPVDLCILNTGFIRLARWLYETTHKIIIFYPVAVNKHVRGIRVGEPVRFNPDSPFGEERLRIKELLERRISSMYQALEQEGESTKQAAQIGKAHKTREQAA